jgi:hypothetical protein
MGIYLIVLIFSYRIVSGNAEHPSDTIQNCTLEVMPGTWSKGRQKSLPSAKYAQLSESHFIFYSFPRDRNIHFWNFFYSDEFDELGKVEGTVPPSMNPVAVLKLSLKSSSENWLILSEVSPYYPSFKPQTSF